MLHVYHSNRLERLIEALSEVTAEPLADVLAGETILVQNLGMARWIEQQLALRHGISARNDYGLPASFFWRILKAWLPEIPDASWFDREAMHWRLFRLLPQRLEQAAFAPLRRYLAADASELRLFQLAGRVADLFDQYLVFRIDRVLAWEQGDEDHWQAQLWRDLCAEVDHAHRGRLLAELERKMAGQPPLPGTLPPRLCLFGLTALPPVYMGLLGALSGFLPVHVFFLNPCQEYWADLVDERGQQTRRARARRDGLPDPTGPLDVGNPLLSSLGHAGQVFLDQLLELGGEEHQWFEPPQGDGLLQRVQRDILELRDPGGGRDERPLPPEDDSIQVHGAHSRLREVQILHDNLLALFERYEGLEPRDIMVMAPDIEQYAPYVDAVFGAAPAATRIPWALADRRMMAERPVLQALQQLLRLPQSRFEASEILGLLEVAALRRRFGLDEVGYERVRTWVRESGIRWSADAQMREELGLPAEAGNSWAFGLERLYLGLALPPDEDPQPYEGVLPYIDIEGGEAACLGALDALVEALRRWRRDLAEPHAMADWWRLLTGLMEGFFDADEDEALLLQNLRDRFSALVEQARLGGIERPLSPQVFRTLVQGILEEQQGAHRFLTGRVTFGNMVPMRSIPFRVLCLIGLNGDDFPRSQRPPSFDLMAQEPRRGDRSRRRDDRYLFLEAILSARDVLYLSHVGRDARDNSIKVPAVVVSELLDYLDRGYAPPHGPPLSQRLLRQHPLQPFSARYFDASDPRLFSYAATWAQAAGLSSVANETVFAGADLTPPDPERRIVEMDELIRFLRHPARYFLGERLAIDLSGAEDMPADVEPFTADGLEGYQLRQEVLGHLLARRQRDEIYRRLYGAGLLPHGLPGDLLLEKALAVAEPFAERLRRRQEQAPVAREVDRSIGDFRVQGLLQGLRPAGRLQYRFGKLKARDRLAAWVGHLVLNILAPDGIDLRSEFLAEDCTLRLEPVADAEDILQGLLQLRWQGLCRPLAFFPETAWAWVDSGERGSAFRSAWDSGYNPAAESLDAAVAIAFRGLDPIGAEFERNAEAILRPLLEHRTEITAAEDL